MGKDTINIRHTLGLLVPSWIKRTIIHEMELPGIPELNKRRDTTAHPLIPLVVLTRAYNRLEYTIQCIDSVARQITKYPYTHIIIDQASDDGTEQWFNWIHKLNKPFWKNVGYIRLNKNIGDFGGLALGLAVVNNKYNRTMQLDNDCTLVSQYAIDNMNYALDLFPPNSIVMCRRLGAGSADGKTGGNVPLVKQSKAYNIKLLHGRSRVYKVNLAVASYLCDRKLLSQAIEAGCDATCKICDSLTPRATSYKLHDVLSEHMQGWDGERFLQHEKYYLGSVALGMNYSRVSPSEILKYPTALIEYALAPQSDPDWFKPGLQIKSQKQ
ncbi:MAG: glycosyltransferase [bacterium]|nr:glycosyltransferase [bacterium]